MADIHLLYNRDVTLPDRIARCWDAIERRIAGTNPGCSLQCPAFHEFTYKGFDCVILRCLAVNTQWIGFIRKNETPLEWKRHDCRPFIAGIDFETDEIVGFHTEHLLTDFMLTRTEYNTPDFICSKLREYIDVCRDTVVKPKKHVRAL